MPIGRYSHFFMIISLFTAALSGCMVGPNFHSPAPPKTLSYTRHRLPDKTTSIPESGRAGKSQHYVVGEDIPAEWWTLFHSPALNQLIQIGLKNSPNLAAAEATLHQAQETLNAQIASSLFPSVTAQLGGQRERFSSQTFGSSVGSNIFNLYNAGVNVSYTLDFFGAARRQIEALQAQVDFSQFELEAAYLTLTSNIVTTAITSAALEAQIQATHELIQSQEDQLQIVRRQFHLGGTSQADVFSQENQLAQTRATLPPLEQSLAQSHHAMSVLVGALPSDIEIPDFNLDKLNLPTRLPVSLPSSLVRQRPDIRASEALLHAACAQVGVATANLYPQITLTGSYGWTSDRLAHLFSPANVVWNYGAALTQPIFDAGALRAKKRAAVDAYEVAAAQYRQTVLQAFQNVADTLRALENDARTLRAQKQAEIAARESLRLTRKQFQLGGVSYLSLLNAERTYQQIRISRIQAEAARFNDTAALFQALGGGWWNADG